MLYFRIHLKKLPTRELVVKSTKTLHKGIKSNKKKHNSKINAKREEKAK